MINSFIRSFKKGSSKESDDNVSLDKKSDFEIEDDNDDEAGLILLLFIYCCNYYCYYYHMILWIPSDSSFINSLKVNLSRLIVYAESADTKLQREVAEKLANEGINNTYYYYFIIIINY